MQKEKSVKSYTRRTKSGKTVVVHAYKAKYDAAEEIRKALAKKEGAGKELANRKKQVEQPIPDNELGFSAEEFKAWYHWDMVDDPKNKAALKVEKALKKSMGVKAYNKFLDDMTDGYSARGHNKAFKGLESSLSSQGKETSTKETTTKRAAAENDKSKNSKKDALLTHYDQFNRKYEGKRVGKAFTLSDDGGTYDAQFVTDGKGRYGVVVKDREDGVNGKYYVALESQEEPTIKKVAKKLGLSYDDTTGEWRETTKSKSTSKNTSTKDKTSANHVTDEDGRKHSTKRNSLGISPAEWAAYNSGGVGIKGMSDKEVKAAIKHVESTLKKTLGSKVKTFKEYLDDSAQGGGDFKTDMKKLQGIMSAKDKTPPKHVTEKSLKQNREGVAAELASAKKEMEKLRLLRKETPAEDKKAHRSVSVKVGKLQKKIWKMEKEWEREQLDNAKKIPDSIMAIAGTRKAPLHSSGFAALSNGKNINYAVVGGNYYRVTEKQLDTIWERSYATRKRRPTK